MFADGFDGVRNFFVVLRLGQGQSALEVIGAIADEFEQIHEVREFIAFDFERFAHCRRKFFGGLAGGGQLGLRFGGVFDEVGCEFGQCFHK